jgi:UDP:flavonoid glycosyltransferase YjiC (YdhE family)
VRGSAAAEELNDVTAVLHHGGPDLAFAAAAHGVPAGMVPERPDRPWAERLAAVGAGIALPAGERDPAVTAAAGHWLSSDPGFTAAASRIRDETAEMPTTAQVAQGLVTAAADGG